MRIFGLDIGFPRLTSTERRQVERVPTDGALSLIYSSIDHPRSRPEEGRDISVRGIRFTSDRKLGEGTPVVLTLRFSSEYAPHKVIEVRARVIRCYRKPLQKRYRIGCAFDRLDAFCYTEIQTFILWLKSRREKLLRYLNDPNSTAWA